MNIINKELFKKINKLIKAYDNIVLARHISPDPDAIGSQIALRDAIKLNYPDKKVYAIGAGVAKFKYFGSLDKLDNEVIEDALLIVLDVPNFNRVDGIDSINYKQIIKIDHHPAEDIIGDVDFTSSDYSSTCEMVAEFLLESKYQMDRKIAENLFLGIVADSDRFLFRNTTTHSIEISLELIKRYNIDFVSLYDNLYFKNYNECKFEAYIINNLTITENGFGYINIDNNVVEQMGVDTTTASTIVNEFNFINELYAWCFITYDERNSIYKANIRSRGPIINEIANHYNGGGHKYASGARLKNKEDVKKLLNDLDNCCKEYLKRELS